MEGKSKPLSKNFSPKEMNSFVDLIQEKRSKLFGSLSASFTFEEKNTVWDDVTSTVSTSQHINESRRCSQKVVQPPEQE